LRCRVRGSSMKPFVRDGDVLTVSPPSGMPPRAGDIVLYRTAAGNALLHRVIDVTQRDAGVWLTIWGDAAAGPLDEVSAERIMGVAVALERGRRSMRLDVGSRRRMSQAWAAIQRVRVRGRHGGKGRCE
jgi:hypothetical protein